MPFDKKGMFTPKYKTYQGRKIPVNEAVKKYVKKAVKGVSETKVVQTVATVANLTTAAQHIASLSAVAQGDTVADRAGNAIEPLRIQGRIVLTADNSCARSCVRVQLIRFKQCDGTIPTLADIMPLSGAVIGKLSYEQPLTATMIAQGRKKFDILYDKLFWFSSATLDSPNMQHVVVINKKLKGKCLFTGASGTDEGNNQLFLFIHTDNNTDGDIQRAYTMRYFFKDA